MANSLPNLFAGLPPEQKEHVKVYLQRNYARAEVYFQTLNVIKIQESPLYEVRLFSLYIEHQVLHLTFYQTMELIGLKSFKKFANYPHNVIFFITEGDKCEYRFPLLSPR
jgi:hypothetical protein